MGRKFGDNLSNTHTPQSSSIKKVVRVRRTTPQSKSSSTQSTPRRLHHHHVGREHKVMLEPGPVGLQLEPVKEDPKYGCRVVRFVDGGPKNPGQARQSGKIQPGDLVVEAEVSSEVSVTYEDIIRALKKTHMRRELTVRSVWDPSFLETQSSLKLHLPTASASSSSSSSSSSSPSSTTETPGKLEETAPLNLPPSGGSLSRQVSEDDKTHSTSNTYQSTPNHQNRQLSSSSEMNPFQHFETAATSAPGTPNRATPTMEGIRNQSSPILPQSSSSAHVQDIGMDISMIHSPSEVVLLSQAWKTPGVIRVEAKKGHSNGPLIIPLYQVGQYQLPPIPPPPPPMPNRSRISEGNRSNDTSQYCTPPSTGPFTPQTAEVERPSNRPYNEQFSLHRHQQMDTPSSIVVTPPQLAASPLSTIHSSGPISQVSPLPPNLSVLDKIMSDACGDCVPTPTPPRMDAQTFFAIGTTPALCSPRPPAFSTPRQFQTSAQFESMSKKEATQWPVTPTNKSVSGSPTSPPALSAQTPFTPSNVKKIYSQHGKDPSKPRMLSRILTNVYNNLAPTVASSSYAIGTTVANKIAPTIAASSYAIGSTVATKIVPALASTSIAIGAKVSTKVGEAIIGNSTEDFNRMHQLKLELLKELSQARMALDVHDTERQRLEETNARLFRENLSLRAEFEQKLKISQVELAKSERKLCEEKEEIRGKVRQHEAANQDLISRLNELESLNQSLNAKVDEAKVHVEELTYRDNLELQDKQAEISMLQSQISQLESHLESEITTLTTQRSTEFQVRITELEKSLHL